MDVQQEKSPLEWIGSARFRAHVIFWSIVGLLFGFILYLLSGILLPFVAGLAIAYLLDPVADWLERRGLPRVAAVTVILLGFLFILAMAIILIAPVLGNQLIGFFSSVPSYIQQLQGFIREKSGIKLGELLAVSSGDVKDSLGNIVQEGTSVMTGVLSSLWTSGQAVLSFISLFVVTPVVAFYLLIDWDRMVEKIDGYLPLGQRDTIHGLVRQMDEGVSNFVRGQLLVAAIIGTFYATALTLAGLNFGLLIGFYSGLVGFIPYIGTLTAGMMAFGVALVQFWPDYTMIAVIAAIFFSGQMLEGYVLQPKLIGGRVGLHPVWIIFALFAFGALFGFLGMLIAVPLAAAVHVLLSFALQKYKESSFYRGRAVALVTSPHGSPKEESGKP